MEAEAIIPGLGEARRRLGALEVAWFCDVRAFHLTDEGTGGGQAYALSLVIDSRPPRPLLRAHFRFLGVENLRVRDFGGGLTRIMGLRVRSILDRQWDRLAFEVDDCETFRIQFQCREARLVSVEPLPG